MGRCGGDFGVTRRGWLQVVGQVDIDLDLKDVARCIVLHATMDVLSAEYKSESGASSPLQPPAVVCRARPPLLNTTSTRVSRKPYNSVHSRLALSCLGVVR